MRHSGWYPDRVLRLYERARYRYNDNLSMNRWIARAPRSFR